MVSSRLFVDELTQRSFGPYIGVPCSFLKPFINYVITREDLDYIAATNEGEALAIAVGAHLAGRRPVVMIQNSGLGNLVNPLTSLAYTFRIPVLLITTWRGQPGLADEPQHEVIGAVTPDLFDLLRIPHQEFPKSDDQISSTIDQIDASMASRSLPYALILPKGRVEAFELPDQDHSTVDSHDPVKPRCLTTAGDTAGLRRDAIEVLVETLDEDCVVIATTGKTGRELFDVCDRPGHFYMVGSMGCASSVGLGICLARQEQSVIVLDGDGAALMRLEAMASIGHWAPPNLIHVILDNGTYDSTGGQTTIADSTSFAHVASGCGYQNTVTLADLKTFREELEVAVQGGGGPHLIHVRIRPGTSPSLGRPTITPPDVAKRLRAAIALGSTAQSDGQDYLI